MTGHDAHPGSVDGGGTISENVVDAVATVEETTAVELSPPLYEAVDPDALDSLFRGPAAAGCVEFTYCGWHVEARANGRVIVTRTDEGTDETAG